MDENTPSKFNRAQRMFALFDLVFLVAAVAMVADVYYLDKATVPAAIPLYGWPVLFAVIMLTYPVQSYVMTRWRRRWTEGTEEDSPRRPPLWERIFKWERETDEQRLCRRLTVAAQMLAAVKGPIWSSYDSGGEIAKIVLECRDAIREGRISLSQKGQLWGIFAPTCEWDDVVGELHVGNAVFELVNRLYWEQIRSDRSASTEA